MLSAYMLGAQEWEVFDDANSPLPVNTVKALAEDGLGRIWMGTDWGLAMYDEGEWAVYQVSNSGLPENIITSVAADGDGRIWVGTSSSGVAVLDNGEWHLYTTANSGLPTDVINHVTVDHRGWAWISTDMGLACRMGASWVVYDTTTTSHGGFRLNAMSIRSAAVRGDGLVAIGTTNGGFHYLTDTSVHVLTVQANDFFDNTANMVCFDPATGDRWVATPAAGLLWHAAEFQHGIWFQFAPSTSSIPTDGLSSLALGPDGRKWLGTYGYGVVVMDGQEFTTHNAANAGLADDNVLSLLVTASGDVWAGTLYGGVARLGSAVSVQGSARPVSRPEAWPNPAHDNVSVALPGMHGAVEWECHDLQGREIARGNVEATGGVLTLDLSGWSAGTYVFRIRHEDHVWPLYLVKQ